MKIAIIGGGPAGLYAAILLKKQRPQAEITVYERNRADDTFGFGVVFSDATLDNFEKYDPPSYRRITQEFAYWDDIAVHFRGTVHRVGGNGFCGCSRRMLLLILQERARELGVTLISRPTSTTKRASPMPISWCWPTASTAASAKNMSSISSPRSTSAPTCSPGWARPGRSMPSPSSSRRPSGARSSPTPINTRRALDQPAHATSMAARWSTGCAFRWRYSRRCARPGRRTSRCRCAFPRPTGPKAASPAMTRWRSRAPSREAGVDLVDVSTGQTVRDAQPVYGRMFQTPFSEQVRNEARVATMCVGNITTADQVNTILAAGRADLVALGRPHLVDPSFTMKAAAWYGADDFLSAAISAGQGADLPQQRARPAGFRRPQN